MAQIYYYVLVTKKRKPIVNGTTLPIYYNKKVAGNEALKFNADVFRVRISDLHDLISEKKHGMFLAPWQ